MPRTRKAGHGKAAKNARKVAAGIPVLKTKNSSKKKFANIIERREQQKEEKHAAGLLQSSVELSRAEQEVAKQPHTFVIHSGSVGRYIKKLEHDMREVMEPNTASKLQVSRRNNFNDFVVNAPVLGVSHIMAFTRTDASVNMRIARMPQGPTLCFKVEKYTLSRDVRGAQKRCHIFQKLFQNAPLVVLNGFNVPEKKHLAVVKTVIQNMFPSINLDTVKLSSVRRAVLINYNNDDDTIDFRHYSIKTVPTGIAKSTKKLVQGRVPDLSKYEDISDFFLNPGALSDSEWEGEQAEVELPQDLPTRGCRKGDTTKLRTIEIGPRMTWKLTKIQEGIDDGEVLYHSYIKKSAKEIVELRKKVPTLKKKKKRMQKDIEHAAIRKLAAAEEERKAEEAEFEELKDKLIRKQKAVTGDDGDSDNEKETPKPESTSQKNQAAPPTARDRKFMDDGESRKRRASTSKKLVGKDAKRKR